VGTLRRLLQNFCSIALDFFALRAPDTRYASFWLAASSRTSEGFRHASLRVVVPLLKDRRALALTVERDTTRLGGALADSVYTRLELDGRPVLEVQKEDAAEITRQDVLQALAAARTQGAELVGALRATPRPWRGSYVCVWDTNGVPLRDAGGVEIEFEKLHADYVAASRASRDAAWELSGAAGEGPEQRARKRART
jgi:CBS domain-containing protein